MGLAAFAIGASILASAVTPGAGEATAHDPQTKAGTDVAPAPDQKRTDRFAPVWSAVTVHKGAEGDVLNEFRIVGRLHLDHYVLDSEVGDASDLAVRRARVGARARLFKTLDAHVEAELDLEGGPMFSRLTDAYVAWRFSDAARLTAGKQSVKFTLDGATSSNELLTIDRSNVANNFWFTDEYAPGISLSGRSGNWSYISGIYSGGRRNRGLGEFDAGYFWLGSVGYDFARKLGVKRAMLRADYVYNEPDPGSDFTRPFDHIGALILVVEAARWGFSGDLVAADGFPGQSDGIGATALPWLNITDRLQVVGRYTFLKSKDRNGLRLARYENVATRGRGDLYHELYGGLNYYIYGHRLKAQTGLSWANMRDRANDGGAYDGWTWTSALRLSW